MDKLYTTTSTQKRSRKSEIALLEKISASLETYIDDNPVSASASSATTKTIKSKNKKPSASDKSKNAAKNFLAAKTLVKSIAKACAQENVALSAEHKVGGATEKLVNSLVEEYQEKYPTLEKKMLVDGICRFNGTADDAEEEDEEESNGDDNELKVKRIIAAVDLDMNKYHERVEALKKSRELAEIIVQEKEAEAKSIKKKKRKSNNGTGGDSESPSPKRPRGRPKGERKEADTPENILINEVVKRYTVERAKFERLPNGLFEAIVDDAKKQCKMESFDMPLNKLDKKVRFKYNKIMSKDEELRTKSANNRHKVIVNEVYVRYSRTKEANGGKLPAGTIDTIIEGVKLEYGMTEVKMNSLKTKVQAKFAKTHPEFQSNPIHVIKIGELSEEDKQRRQLLMNEVTVRYVREKEDHSKKKMADGTLDRIIEEVKNDLGIHEFDVPKASIRGRINRKSLYVQTLGNDSPYDVIDEPLVSTINSWLSQGISVTRAQGLDLANQLLKGKNLGLDKSGKEIVLDAKWWRNFLERNKKRLVCSSGN